MFTSKTIMHTPGYKTSEHALTWAVIALGAIALWRGDGAFNQLAALLGPAIASAAYSHSRGKVKSPGPFDQSAMSTALRQTLGEMFRGRIVK